MFSRKEVPLIAISCAVARQCRALFRLLSPGSRSTGPPAVALAADGAGLRLRSSLGGVMVEHHDPNQPGKGHCCLPAVYFE